MRLRATKLRAIANDQDNPVISPGVEILTRSGAAILTRAGLTVIARS
jgi:hypothetical protein